MPDNPSIVQRLFPREVVTVSATPDMWAGELYPEEAEIVARAVPKRRREFTAGRACARQALALLGFPSRPLLADRDGLPIWPDGVVGSLTHCKDYCGAALALSGGIVGLGFDAEPIGPAPAELQHLICTPRERAWIERQQPPSKGDWYGVTFSAKESVLKAIFPFTRRRFEFTDVEIAFDSSAGQFAFQCSRSVGEPAHHRYEGRYAISATHVFTSVIAKVDV